jgi:uncharacterized protein (DUF885 family)
MAEPDQAALALADRFWERLLEIEPIIGTSVGDDRYDDRLPDPSEEGLADRESFYRGALDDLAAIDGGSLAVAERTTLDVMEAIASRERAAIASRLDRLQVVSHLWGPGQLLAELGSLQRADTPERLDRYLSRLRAIPGYLLALEPVMRSGVSAGQTAPSVVVDRAIAQVERLIAAGPDGSPAMAPVAGDNDAGERVKESVRDSVLPAYERYLAAMRDYRPSATETIGLAALPDGDAMYAAQILSWTSLPLGAQEVHDIGLRELATIQDERRETAARLGYDDPATALAEHQASGGNQAASRDDMVRIAEEQVRRGWDAAPTMFGRLPKQNCDVRAVEEFREADMPFAFYNPPTADGSRPGVYYINTSDLEERPLHQLATTTYHEANPGHHFQFSIELELPDRPPLRQFGGILAGSAFIEGWGLYSERLGDEMGLYLDEHERLGMLDMQAFRACRLVADTGIHALGWNRERAVRQMMESGVPHLEASTEVDRYIALPGQALSYMVGQLEIRGWRSEAERATGTFDIREFHDRLLELGSLPLPALRREMAAPADPA